MSVYTPKFFKILSTSSFSVGMCLITSPHRNSAWTLSYPWIMRLRVLIISFAWGSGKFRSIFNIRFIASPIISVFRSTAHRLRPSLTKTSYRMGVTVKIAFELFDSYFDIHEDMGIYSSINQTLFTVDGCFKKWIFNTSFFN